MRVQRKKRRGKKSYGGKVEIESLINKIIKTNVTSKRERDSTRERKSKVMERRTKVKVGIQAKELNHYG